MELERYIETMDNLKRHKDIKISGWKMTLIDKDGEEYAVVSGHRPKIVLKNRASITIKEEIPITKLGAVWVGDTTTMIYDYHLQCKQQVSTEFATDFIRFETDHINPRNADGRGYVEKDHIREGETELDAFSGKMNSYSATCILLLMADDGGYPLENYERYNELIATTWEELSA